jgi:hypothetical protein
MKNKWITLGLMAFGGSTLFQGCLSFSANDFWNGFWNSGWPTQNRWVNLTVDILNEELFG